MTGTNSRPLTVLFFGKAIRSAFILARELRNGLREAREATVYGGCAAAGRRKEVQTVNPLAALYKIAVLAARAALLLLAFLLLPVLLLLSGRK